MEIYFGCLDDRMTVCSSLILILIWRYLYWAGFDCYDSHFLFHFSFMSVFTLQICDSGRLSNMQVNSLLISNSIGINMEYIFVGNQ